MDNDSRFLNREKTPPFLIRTFVRIGGFHRLDLFEDNMLPTTDEHQVFSWKDSTLRELLTALRITAAHVPELRHTLARFAFRAIYADPGNRGRFAQKDLGMVYSRDILGDPGSVGVTAPRLLQDDDDQPARHEDKREGETNGDGANGNGEDAKDNERARRNEKTLEDLRFVPGDYLCVSVILPKSLTNPAPPASEGLGLGLAGRLGNAIGGRGGPGAGGAAAASWKSAPLTGGAGGGGEGWGRDRDRERDRDHGDRERGGGGHWRGASDGPPPRGGRGGGRGGGFVGGRNGAEREREIDRSDRLGPRDRNGDRDRDRGALDYGRERDGDRRVPPPRRDSPPPRSGRGGRRGGGGWGARGGGRRSISRSASRSRSRSPPPRRRGGRQ